METRNPQYAGFARRFTAVVLDWLLFTLVTAVAGLGMQNLPEWGTKTGWTAAGYQQAGYWIPAAAVVFTLFCWVRLQGTPGKLLMGCRIIDSETGGAPGLGKAILRYLGYLVSALPLCLGFLWILWDRQRQGFHDKLAGTRVVMDDESEKSLHQLMRELG